VFPSLSMYNSPNTLRCNPVASGDVFLGFALIVPGTNLKNFFGGELGKMLTLAFCISCVVGSVLCVHIVHVLLLRTRQQMRGIRAISHVTAMENLQSVWDRAMRNFPCNAMSQVASCSEGRKVSIAVDHCVASPQPTRSSENGMDGAVLVHPIPEALLIGTADAMPRHKALGLTLDMVPFGACALGYRRLLPAATFAATVFNFVKSKLGLHKFWGMLAHADYLLLGIGQARDTVEVSPGIFACSYTSSIAHLSAKSYKAGRIL